MILLITTAYRSICAWQALPNIIPKKIIHLHFIQQKYVQPHGLKRGKQHLFGRKIFRY